MAGPAHPVRAGQFIWCLFPYDQDPEHPGPEEHVTYVLQIGTDELRKPIAVCAYSTSQPWTGSPTPPVGTRIFSKDQAEKLGQNKSFRLILTRLAKLPIDNAFFPRLKLANHGIVMQTGEHFHTAINTNGPHF